jgi:2-(1,2-epoxy-1,2-dihydrophenyl)acetyl-CoA isomerase
LDLALAFEAAIDECQSNRAVRAILLRGEGRMFCGGGDVAQFARQSDLPDYLWNITLHLHRALSVMTKLDAPIVAAVQGAAAGAGMGLVCAADLVVASDSARFVMAYTQVGLSPDGSSSWFLPRLVGHRRALELTLTNRALDANEALAWGIVSRVVPENELEDTARELATQLALGPTGSFGRSKRLLTAAQTSELEAQLEREALMLRESAGTAEAREGITAFMGKRKPDFSAIPGR